MVTGGEDRIRVLIADDHPIMRDGIAVALESSPDMEVVGQAADGAEAIVRFRELLPDVALIDLQMPGVDGLQAIHAISAEFPQARIIVLTSYPGDARVRRALTQGANAYMLKTATREEILTAIRSVMSGRRVVASEVAGEIASHAWSEMLSDRELSVLRLVATGNTNKRIADILCVSEDTVKARLKNIMTKLGALDRTHAVTLARNRGFFDG
ncbi:response regulator transcription factor [Dyella jiangningensis]|jgi:DNA-binding NarL/FixJ family response regulator|uniref:response regulator n=1 Tax=Dyella jiangningensis TaxID=1379159 RepID=UPI00056F96DA|nr:response regulator transcription factor [Dyella jiangningensis]MDG2538973.1 response regulator transcription factor [Dyella jiangningensis]